MDYPDTVLRFESTLCAIAAYLCFVQWIYCSRQHVSYGWDISINFIQSILLATSSTLLFVSETAELATIVYIKNSRAFADTWMGLQLPNNNTADEYESFQVLADRLCHVTAIFCVATLLALHGVIWIRQRTMYRKKALAHLSNNATRFLSKYFYIYVAVVVISAFSCVYGLRLTYREPRSVDIFVLLMVCPWGVQLPLVLLFLHPLIKLLRRNRSSDITTHGKYARVMKRVIVITAICMLTHTAMAISYLNETVLLQLRFSLLHLNLTVNLICISLIPTDRKARLVPWVPSCGRFQPTRDDMLDAECAIGQQQ